MDASIPGFALRDDYRSSATPDLCSLELDKTFTHGTRKSDEKVTFDQQNHTATRETLNGGGKADLSISACAKDALTFMQFARNELAQGRLAPQQPVDFGALYNVRIEFTGAQKIKVGDQTVDADRILATIKGPTTESDSRDIFRPRRRADSSAGPNSAVARLVHGRIDPVKIAFFSPLPPAKSGIADYSAVLLDHLKNFAEVETFASRPATVRCIRFRRHRLSARQ